MDNQQIIGGEELQYCNLEDCKNKDLKQPCYRYQNGIKICFVCICIRFFYNAQKYLTSDGSVPEIDLKIRGVENIQQFTINNKLRQKALKFIYTNLGDFLNENVKNDDQNYFNCDKCKKVSLKFEYQKEIKCIVCSVKKFIKNITNYMKNEKKLDINSLELQDGYLLTVIKTLYKYVSQLYKQENLSFLQARKNRYIQELSQQERLKNNVVQKKDHVEDKKEEEKEERKQQNEIINNNFEQNVSDDDKKQYIQFLNYQAQMIQNLLQNQKNLNYKNSTQQSDKYYDDQTKQLKAENIKLNDEINQINQNAQQLQDQYNNLNYQFNQIKNENNIYLKQYQ